MKSIWTLNKTRSFPFNWCIWTKHSGNIRNLHTRLWVGTTSPVWLHEWARRDCYHNYYIWRQINVQVHPWPPGCIDNNLRYKFKQLNRIRNEVLSILNVGIIKLFEQSYFNWSLRTEITFLKLMIYVCPGESYKVSINWSMK